MSLVKLSDWVAEKCAELGVRHVFMVTGGGAMHLNHSLGTNSKLECVFNHHEQACAMAAEAYARMSNRVALVNVTSGPGGTNAITGVYGAYVDSLPVVVISGQVKFETTVRSTKLPLRQYGDQELDIEELIRPVTKYSVMVTDPLTIRYHLEKAFYLARSGRPGPVWLDIPLDVQAAKINPADLKSFDPASVDEPWTKTNLEAARDAIISRLKAAKRPVIFAGAGVRLSGRHDAFIDFIEKIRVPVVTGWNAHDALPDSHPLSCGRPGTVGDRPGNFAVQNADLLLVLGSRLNIRQVSYNWASFAREAFKIWVDIDPQELNKPNVRPDLPILADLKDLLPVLAEADDLAPSREQHDWLAWCRERLEKYPVVLDDYWGGDVINPYCFMDKLFEKLEAHDVIVAGNGSACVVSFQAAKLKLGQRLWTNSGCASMGYDLPAAIGACKANENRKTICLAGDGSIMMNLQELQTISGYNLPIKIFILNNNGYVSIFQTHRNFFAGVEVGAGPKSGVSFPDFSKLIPAFGIQYRRCAQYKDMEQAIAETLGEDGPSVCEVILDEHQPFAPKLSSKQHPNGKITSPALEDLAPFLPRDELLKNLLIKPFDE